MSIKCYDVYALLLLPETQILLVRWKKRDSQQSVCALFDSAF